jgi:hypothetical protein
MFCYEKLTLILEFLEMRIVSMTVACWTNFQPWTNHLASQITDLCICKIVQPMFFFCPFCLKDNIVYIAVDIHLIKRIRISLLICWRCFVVFAPPLFKLASACWNRGLQHAWLLCYLCSMTFLTSALVSSVFFRWHTHVFLYWFLWLLNLIM